VDNIPKNQIKSRNTIEQREHEDDASARRVLNVDPSGNPVTDLNPLHVRVMNQLVTERHDDVLLAYDPVTQDMTTAEFKFQGSTVALVNFEYDEYSNLTRAYRA
jgi:hypothetical protein